MKKREREYAIYRHGSNAGNQHLTPTRVVAVIKADSPEEAVRLVETKTAVIVYNNQHLTAKPIARLSQAAREEAYEAERLRQEEEKEMDHWA